MKKLKLLIFLLIVVLLVVLGFFGIEQKTTATEKPIKIGSISAQTGVGAAIGQEELKGALLAVEEINKSGGILGRPVELIAEDLSIDKLKTAGSVAHKLVQIDKVVAIVGPQWDEPAIAILPIIEEAMVPTIGPDTTDSIEINGLGDYLFSTWYDNRVGVNEILRYAQSRGVKTLAIMRPLNAGFWKFASDLIVERAPNYDITVVADVEIGNPLETDFRTHISKVKEKTPDAIFHVTSDPVQCPFMQQIQELEYGGLIFATESAGNSASLGQCPGALKELYFSTPATESAGYTNFKNAFIKKFGRGLLFPSAVTAYDAVKIIAHALEKTNLEGGKVLRDEIAKTKDFPGASLPSITFDEKGFMITPGGSFETRTVKNNEFVKAE